MLAVATIACLLLDPTSAFAQPDPAPPTTTFQWMDQAYARRRAHDTAGARDAFEHARAGATPEQAQRIHMELAYLEMQEGNRSDAIDHFEGAAEGPDRELAAQARRELDAQPSHFWGDFYAEAVVWQRLSGYDNSNAAFTARVRGAYRPFLDLDLSLYLYAQATHDLRSTATSDFGPLIYADNYALLGAGVLLRLAAGHVGLFAQVGPAFYLMEEDARHDAIALDARAGILAGWNTSMCRIPSDGDVRFVSAPCVELYGEAVWVSRFDNNVIGLARGRIAHGWLLTGPVLWAPFVEARAAVDANGDYYNNFADAGVGHRWRLLRPVIVDALLGIHAGTYFGRENVDPMPPDGNGYVEVRFVASTYFDF